MEKIEKRRNFRELGGIFNNEDKRVKGACLFRSGNLNEMSKKEENYLSRLGIKDIIDFRSEEEREVDPYQISFKCNYHPIVALHTKDGLENFYFSRLINKKSTKEDVLEASRFVREGYRILPFRNKAYQKVFDLMLSSDDAILFHCSSGKDRTGLMAALILKVLDVNDQIIMKDYLYSNQNVMHNTLRHIDELGFTGAIKDTLIYCCTVHEELLLSSYEEIIKKYKSWDTYFEVEYGLNEDKRKYLKEKYLIDKNEG